MYLEKLNAVLLIKKIKLIKFGNQPFGKCTQLYFAFLKMDVIALYVITKTSANKRNKSKL